MPNSNSIGGYGGHLTANGTISGSVSSASISPSPVFYTYGSASTENYTLSTVSDSPDLPDITINTSDEHGNPVVMKIAPESNISASECMKMTMLMTALMSGGSSFNALAYVKKQNLERHFTFS